MEICELAIGRYFSKLRFVFVQMAQRSASYEQAVLEVAGTHLKRKVQANLMKLDFPFSEIEDAQLGRVILMLNKRITDKFSLSQELWLIIYFGYFFLAV